MFLSVIGTSIINIMFNMLFNIRYNPDDKELVDIMSMNNQVTSSFTFNDPTAWMKWLRHVYPTQNYLLVKDAIAKRDKYLSKYLKEHFQTYKEGVKRDFTDYLIELSRHNKHSSIANESDLEMILTDMIFAGTESTMTALQWMVVYLIHWPEYQDRLLNDILKNTETGRYPCLKDKPKLHFVQAFTQEVLRFSSFVPMCPPHKTMADEKVDSYVIPEGTTVFYNIWAIHQQEEHFPYPKKFNPDRWLSKDGHFQNSKSLMIFSVGKRACLGETSARTQMFLFLTRLIRDFKILPEPNIPLPELGGVIAVGISPKPFKVIFRSRTRIEEPHLNKSCERK